MRLMLALLFALSPWWACAEPHNLRGITLGISIDEFRALPFPDGAGAKVICHKDPETKEPKHFSAFSDLWLLGDEATSGAFACRFYKFGKLTSIREGWYDAGLKVATIGTYTMYVFLPDRSQVPRLLRIEIRSNAGYWPTFWEGFTQRYGKPTRMSADPIQNKMGASFDNTIAVWENGESAITLQKRYLEIERTQIIYEHKALAALVRERIQQKKGRPKDNL